MKLRGRPQDWAGGVDEAVGSAGPLAAQGDELGSSDAPELDALPAKGYKLYISLWDQQFEAADEEGNYLGRRFKRTTVQASSHRITYGALVWFDAETGAENGIPWWRIASYDVEPRPQVPWATTEPVVNLSPAEPDHSVAPPEFDTIEDGEKLAPADPDHRVTLLNRKYECGKTVWGETGEYSCDKPPWHKEPCGRPDREKRIADLGYPP